MKPQPSHLAPLLRAAAVMACFTAASAVAEAPKWQLAWRDDFDSLDESRWTRVDSTEPTNNSLHAYLPQQVTASEGKLVITSTDQPYGGLPYRSGQVISKSQQRFGRWEVRAKLPTSQGMWPAVWLLPDVAKHRWPSGGEIDIMENRGSQPTLTSSAFHYGTNPPFRHDFVYQEQQTLNNGRLADYHTDYHTYAVDWTERYVRFYVDGVNHYTVYDQDVGHFLSRSTQPMQLVINNAIGGHFLPDPDASTQWPQQMHVDWVRVYELADGPGEAAFVNGGFEADGGSLSGWSLFGINSAQTQNASAASEAVLDGRAALKLYGAFANGERFSGLTQGITVEPGQEVVAAASALVRAEDSIAGTDNRVLMKIEFYDRFGAKYGDGLLAESERLLAGRRVQHDRWVDHELRATAPAGAVEARLALVFDQPSGAAGAVHIDAVSLTAGTPLAGDFNSDGRVDAADYTLWRDAVNQTGQRLAADANADGRVDSADYAVWAANFGPSSPGARSALVPEPSGVAITAAFSTAVSLAAPAHRTLGRR